MIVTRETTNYQLTIVHPRISLCPLSPISQSVAFLLTIMKMHKFISKTTFKFQPEILAWEKEKGWMKILFLVKILKVFNLS